MFSKPPNLDEALKAGLPIPFEVIALSLSGGGYRATAFHLGTLTYLDRIKYNGKPLLESVKVLSTVSGGTFTGAVYSACIQKGESILDCYSKLYRFMSEVDVVQLGLSLLNGKEWNSFKQKNLINAFSEVYFRELTNDTLGIFYTEKTNHTTELCFNATDFSNGLNFRFQKTLGDSGYFGNKYSTVNISQIKEIRLADIIASSSCFPGGFEPLAFPHDFRHINSHILNKFTEKVDRAKEKAFPIYIMDGGIYDNQGIDSIILAKQRIKKYYPEMAHKPNPIDLLIISDVAYNKMQPLEYTKNNETSIFDNLSFATISKYGIGIWTLSAFVLYILWKTQNKILLICLSIIFALIVELGMIASFAGRFVLKQITNLFHVPVYFTEHLVHFGKLRFCVLSNFINERIESVLKMMIDVFPNQVRRLSLKQIYENKDWENKRILNALWDLSEKKIQDKINSYSGSNANAIAINSSQKLLDVTEKSLSKGTALWFEKCELEGTENMLNSIIACGQYTICFNLIEYVERLKNSEYYNLYPDQVQKGIETLYQALQIDWKHFNNSPYWLVHQLNNQRKD